MNPVQNKVLEEVSGLHGTPQGAYNIRVNGQSGGRANTKNVQIVSKIDKPGIDIIVQPGTKHELVHIPVVIDQSGLDDLVYNDFYIGADSDVVIIAGCGIHNDGTHMTQHNGIHSFHIGKNARVRYEEKHYGEGGGSGERILNPETIIHLESGSYMEMNSVQIEGVDSTDRLTKATIEENASLVTKEVIMTSGTQLARTDFQIELNGEGSSAHISSRSVAKEHSKQEFRSVMNGNNASKGYSACDAIIMDDAVVKAVPDVTANHVDAELVHEAAIGKIAGDQVTKLMTLGLTQEEAEEYIVAAFLR